MDITFLADDFPLFGLAEKDFLKNNFNYILMCCVHRMLNWLGVVRLGMT